LDEEDLKECPKMTQEFYKKYHKIPNKIGIVFKVAVELIWISCTIFVVMLNPLDLENKEVMDAIEDFLKSSFQFLKIGIDHGKWEMNFVGTEKRKELEQRYHLKEIDPKLAKKIKKEAKTVGRTKRPKSHKKYSEALMPKKQKITPNLLKTSTSHVIATKLSNYENFMEFIAKQPREKILYCCKDTNTNLTVHEVISLEKDAWLSGDIIDVFLHQVCAPTKDYDYCSQYWSQKLLNKATANNSPDILAWKATIQLIDILQGKSSKKTVLIPVNVNSSHWVLCYINVTTKNWCILDSLGKSSDKDVFVTKFEKFLEEQVVEPNYSKCTFPISINQPQQNLDNDSYNCGVYICYYVKALVDGASIPQIVRKTTSKSIMNAFRKIIWFTLKQLPGMVNLDVDNDGEEEHGIVKDDDPDKTVVIIPPGKKTRKAKIKLQKRLVKKGTLQIPTQKQIEQETPSTSSTSTTTIVTIPQKVGNNIGKNDDDNDEMQLDEVPKPKSKKRKKNSKPNSKKSRKTSKKSTPSPKNPNEEGDANDENGNAFVSVDDNSDNKDFTSYFHSNSFVQWFCKKCGLVVKNMEFEIANINNDNDNSKNQEVIGELHKPTIKKLITMDSLVQTTLIPKQMQTTKKEIDITPKKRTRIGKTKEQLPHHLNPQTYVTNYFKPKTQPQQQFSPQLPKVTLAQLQHQQQNNNQIPKKFVFHPTNTQPGLQPQPQMQIQMQLEQQQQQQQQHQLEFAFQPKTKLQQQNKQTQNPSKLQEKTDWDFYIEKQGKPVVFTKKYQYDGPDPFKDIMSTITEKKKQEFEKKKEIQKVYNEPNSGDDFTDYKSDNFLHTTYDMSFQTLLKAYEQQAPKTPNKQSSTTTVTTTNPENGTTTELEEFDLDLELEMVKQSENNINKFGDSDDSTDNDNDDKDIDNNNFEDVNDSGNNSDDQNDDLDKNISDDNVTIEPDIDNKPTSPFYETSDFSEQNNSGDNNMHSLSSTYCVECQQYVAASHNRNYHTKGRNVENTTCVKCNGIFATKFSRDRHFEHCYGELNTSKKQQNGSQSSSSPMYLESFLGKFKPCSTITKGKKKSKEHLTNNILTKLVAIYPQYLSDSINYFAFLTNIIKYTSNGKVNELMKPLSLKSISGYTSHILSFLLWYQQSFPNLKSSNDANIILPLLFTNYITTQICPFFEKCYQNSEMEPKTIMNIYISLKRFLVMLLDMQFLSFSNADEINAITHSKHKNFCYWMKNTLQYISLRISHFG
jgi:hypothetical protein